MCWRQECWLLGKLSSQLILEQVLIVFSSLGWPLITVLRKVTYIGQ